MTDQKPVRLDKWLWAARFYKTRAIAKDAIEGGKVHYNGARTRPSRAVELEATIRLRVGWDEKTIIVRDLSDQRRGAPEAQKLYEETEESVQKRQVAAQARKDMNQSILAPEKRPSKKQRRDILKIKHDYSDD
ncbi:ribosome-associated heat shock protein Hsp15 [Gynuella sunshinyii]|uniref:Heat shock protein 15 n=1 Tax=Gynuella sunshinyii YC6258 TaxID=1445510 RepID=A0A0C5VSW4_9GAMM|nr:ribosome-associated heat shock protein Hsp15 [Gynuella sunshinyii]AJQ97742.1 ribosome-associated heat shock protein implicated in the recycling of the 50S subunit (S4-like protein) [Gynuella sunshinyii YC6258]